VDEVVLVNQPETPIARIREKLAHMFRKFHHECTDCTVGNRCILSFPAYTSGMRAPPCFAVPFFLPSGFHVSSPWRCAAGTKKSDEGFGFSGFFTATLGSRKEFLRRKNVLCLETQRLLSVRFPGPVIRA
jgi:hypothetical protein